MSRVNLITAATTLTRFLKGEESSRELDRVVNHDDYYLSDYLHSKGFVSMTGYLTPDSDPELVKLVIFLWFSMSKYHR